MDLSQYAELFLAESREHLGTINQLLLEWERDPKAQAPVAEIFRAMHTIKGMAHAMGYTRVGDVAHRAETLLDQLRRGERRLTDDALEALFRAADTLERGIEVAVRDGGDGSIDVAPAVSALDALMGGPRPAAPRAAGSPEPARSPEPAEPAVEGSGVKVQVHIRFDAQLKGARALVALRRAGTLGRVHNVEPSPGALEHDDFDGRFAFRLDSNAPPATIEREVRAAGDVEQVTIETAEAGARSEAAGTRGRHIRVDLRRLDALMTSVGELVTERERLAACTTRLADPQLDEVVERMTRNIRDLQNEIVEARLTPVWQVFDRFPRLVRDMARRLGKQVEFQVEGKEIELDRSVLDEIGDPLIHLLRNAMDHGIEAPEARIAAGKPAMGRIVLSAARERAAVAITVADDGKGIDPSQILAEAQKRGLVGADVDQLSDDLLLRVLARPGFSTASTVSDVSGRGVGIDVVSTRLRALGGAVEMRTQPGVGTAFTLRVPPTLAIVRALLTQVGKERYALPLAHVAETVAYRADAITHIDGREAMTFRDHVIPLTRLGNLLKVPGFTSGSGPVVVLEIGERRSGIVVDAMIGQQEVVVRPFDGPRGTLPVFTGAAILGDGMPVLILDAGGLVSFG